MITSGSAALKFVFVSKLCIQRLRTLIIRKSVTSEVSRTSKGKPQVCTYVHTCIYLTSVFLSAYASIKLEENVSVNIFGGQQ